MKKLLTTVFLLGFGIFGQVVQADSGAHVHDNGMFPTCVINEPKPVGGCMDRNYVFHEEAFNAEIISVNESTSDTDESSLSGWWGERSTGEKWAIGGIGTAILYTILRSKKSGSSSSVPSGGNGNP